MKRRIIRPLIFPVALLIVLAVLAEYLKSLAGIDTTLIAVVQQIPQSLTPEFTFITNLGSVPVLVVVAAAAAAYEYFHRHKVRAAVMLGSLLSMGAFLAVKEIVRRARPVTDYVAAHGLHDYSFPSGHSTGSAAVYGMIVVLLWHHGQTRRSQVLSGLLIMLIGLIGLSRVYLGAHFPTDVFGGWLLALVIVSVLRSISVAVADQQSVGAPPAEETTEAAR